MSYKNLSEEAREGLSGNFEMLSRDEMKNCMAKPIKPIKNFFRWVPDNLDLIICCMVIVLAAIAVFGVYFDWLKL